MTFWICLLFSYNVYQASAVAVVPPVYHLPGYACRNPGTDREGLCDADRLAPDFSDDLVLISIYHLWLQWLIRWKLLYINCICNRLTAAIFSDEGDSFRCLFGCLSVIVDCYHLNNDKHVTLAWSYVCEDVLAISFWSRRHSIGPWVDYVHIFSAYIIQ